MTRHCKNRNGDHLIILGPYFKEAETVKTAKSQICKQWSQTQPAIKSNINRDAPLETPRCVKT